MEPLDLAFEKFQAFREVLESGDVVLSTEADTRLKMIDPIFCNILNWPISEILAEDKSIDGFADYNLKVQGRSRVIVEAKRDGRTLGCENKPTRRAFKLDGPAFSSSTAREGINQGIRYRGSKSAELACVTNGNEWIVFRGNRLGDGKDVINGMAFIFSNLDQVEQNFSFFYDLLSYESSGKFGFRPYFQEAEGKVIRASSFRKALNEPGSSRLMPSSKLASDIDRIMIRFFDRLTGDRDPDLLVECFVETSESRSADGQLAKISEDIIHRIRQLDTGGAAALTQLIERATHNRQHEFVVIVGTKGAGKTTFITRFFEKVLRPDIATLCVPIRVNVGNSTGDSREIVSWLDSHLLEATEKQIFGNDPPSFNEIMGSIYFDEYMRLSKGPWSKLYETNKDEFKIKFGDWVESQRESKPSEHIARLIRFVVQSKKMLPIVVFDNADHYDVEFQEHVYQYARSIYEREVCLVILPITDRTSWQLSKHGALQSFEHEALFLPTPSTEHVIRKRIEFINSRIEMERSRPEDRYFVKNGISLTIDDLAAFTKSLQEVFLNTAETSRWIGSLSNHDIRRSLNLARMFVTSAHLNVEDLVKAYYAGTALYVSKTKAARAMIRGNYRTYTQGQHPFVQNIYACAADIDTSPLLGLRILQMLADSSDSDNDGDGPVGIDQMIQYCQTIGIDPRATTTVVDTLLKSGLVQNFDPTITDIAAASQISITPSGDLHLRWGSSNFEYVSSMADVTYVMDRETIEEMRESLAGANAARRKSKIFLDYLLREDGNFYQPSSHPSYAGQVALVAKIESAAKQLVK